MEHFGDLTAHLKMSDELPRSCVHADDFAVASEEEDADRQDVENRPQERLNRLAFRLDVALELRGHSPI
jgi:hypothetical protein